MGTDILENATHLTALIGSTESGDTAPANKGPAGLDVGQEFYNTATIKYMIATSTSSYRQTPALTTTSTTTS